MPTSVAVEGRVTRKRYWELVANGTIGPDDRVELLDGVIVSMSPQNPPHAFSVATLTEAIAAFAAKLGVSLRVQLPLDLSELSSPEPDIAVVPGSATDYVDAHPTTALLVVEVADSSVPQDRLTKAPLYAAAGVGEYWLVNLRNRSVEVFRRPLPSERRFAETYATRPGETLAPASLPGFTIAVGEILPPAKHV